MVISSSLYNTPFNRFCDNYINITKFVLINKREKDHSMIETRRLKNVVIFVVTISRKIIYIYIYIYISQIPHICDITPPQEHQPSLICQVPPLNLQIVQAPFF